MPCNNIGTNLSYLIVKYSLPDIDFLLFKLSKVVSNGANSINSG